MVRENFEQLITLAQQRTLDGQSGLAASLAKICLDSEANLSEAELTLTFEILQKLITRVESQIREYIANYLADREDVPQDLLTFLIHDQSSIAYPILVRSKQISDMMLVKVIENESPEHWHAILERQSLSTKVTDSLIATHDIKIFEHLLNHQNARLSTDGFATLIDASITHSSLTASLLNRKEMTPALARKMYNWVGATLRDYIQANFDISGDLIEDAVFNAVEALQKGQINKFSWHDSSGNSYAQRFIAATEKSGEAGFHNALVRITDLSRLEIEHALTRDGHMSTALVCKAFNFSIEQFHILMLNIHGARFFETLSHSGELDKVSAFFRNLTVTDARVILMKWLPLENTVIH